MEQIKTFRVGFKMSGTNRNITLRFLKLWNRISVGIWQPQEHHINADPDPGSQTNADLDPEDFLKAGFLDFSIFGSNHCKSF